MNIPNISAADRKAYEFFSQMAERNSANFAQVPLLNGKTGNFISSNSGLDCYVTQGEKLVGAGGFKASEGQPVKFASMLFDFLDKITKDMATRREIVKQISAIK